MVQYAVARELAPTGWNRWVGVIWIGIREQRTADRLIAAFVRVVEAAVDVEMVGSRRVRSAAGRLMDALDQFGKEAAAGMHPGAPQERFDAATSEAGLALRAFILTARTDRWWRWWQRLRLRRSMQR
jgi:hypothetical protein